MTVEDTANDICYYFMEKSFMGITIADYRHTKNLIKNLIEYEQQYSQINKNNQKRSND